VARLFEGGRFFGDFLATFMRGLLHAHSPTRQGGLAKEEQPLFEESALFPRSVEEMDVSNLVTPRFFAWVGFLMKEVHLDDTTAGRLAFASHRY
jgi:hypothetical protein